MAKIKINLNEIPDGFSILPAGKYSAKLFEVEETESAKGNPMLVWTWLIDGGEHQGHELRSYTSLQEHALFGLKEHLEAFGLSGDLDFDTDKLLNRRVMLTVTQAKVKNRKTNEDMDVNRVEAVGAVSSGSGMGNAMTDFDVPF